MTRKAAWGDLCHHSAFGSWPQGNVGDSEHSEEGRGSLGIARINVQRSGGPWQTLVIPARLLYIDNLAFRLVRCGPHSLRIRVLLLKKGCFHGRPEIQSHRIVYEY